MSENKCNYRDEINKCYYLTTAINYTNGAPHMGHAYEIVVSDVLVKIAKLYGYNTRFQTGTDEHGQKIFSSAEKLGLDPKCLCDQNVELFKSMNTRLLINCDKFIRTTDPDHYFSSQELWKLCEKNGDIYLGKYCGWYNVREETFITELEAKLSNFKDLATGQQLIKMEEPSYFFRITKYLEKIKRHIIENPEFIQPESSRENVLSRLESIINNPEDLSISRTTFSWGIPVPEDPKHVMYVWFDALTNYITGLNWYSKDKSLFDKYWKNTVHIVGKDIIWFHCVIWPAILMSAGLSLPKTIFAHGFVTASDGKKMSKSLGNVVNPIEQLENIGSDTFRYYLVREGRFGNDIKYQISSVIDYHNGELADSFGNLVSRITNLTHKFCQGVVPQIANSLLIDKPVKIEDVFQTYYDAWNCFRIDECVHIALNLSKEINKFLTDQSPWNKEINKTAEEKVEVIRIVLEGLYYINVLLSPFTPNSCEEVASRLGTPIKPIVFVGTDYNNLMPNTQIKIGEPLFKRISCKPEKTFEELKAEKKERKKAQKN